MQISLLLVIANALHTIMTTTAESANEPATSLPSLSSLLESSSLGTDALFSSSSPFASSSSSSDHLQSVISARISSKISSEWNDARVLHPAIQAQQQGQGGSNGVGAGPSKPPADHSQSIQSEWIDAEDKRRNGAGTNNSNGDSQQSALVRRSDVSLPGHEFDRNSSLPLALQLKRRQLDKTAKPETFHPRWKLSRVIAGHLGWVRSIAVEPGNQWFATGAGDRMIKVSD